MQHHDRTPAHLPLSRVADLAALGASARLAAWGLILLLVAVFPANVFMYRHPEGSGLPPSSLLLRLPFQAVLVLWAYLYTRR